VWELPNNAIIDDAYDFNALLHMMLFMISDYAIFYSNACTAHVLLYCAILLQLKSKHVKVNPSIPMIPRFQGRSPI